SDALKVFWKEFRVSIVIGICVSLVNFVRIILLDHNGILVALTVCVSMLLIVIIAKCFGGLLPMAAKKVGIDPALMSGPMMASLTDMVSLGTYFVMAKYFLNL
ncbi:MAG: magnesium transporter, partial [Eubacteriales bacterium]|nr:magnesium transporter [Eubacteriales bacterium]